MPYKLFYVLLSTTESEDQGRVVWGKLSLAQIVHGASCLHSFEDMYTQVCSSYVMFIFPCYCMLPMDCTCKILQFLKVISAFKMFIKELMHPLAVAGSFSDLKSVA